VTRGLQALQPFVKNRLPTPLSPRARLCGLVGDHPSSYSRSPSIWNAAFRELGLDALYVPFDVAAADLAPFVGAARAEPSFLGMNVTVPHKQAIVPLLDELDAGAERLGAVNTVVRTEGGRLLGANTDGEGAVASLTRGWIGQPEPFLGSLDRRSVLLIGAGGAGAAVAFALAEAIGPHGRLFVANRTPETALALGEAVAARFGNAQGLDEADAELLVPGIDLIVNASTRGQAGPCPAGPGRVTYLEPYSALAPAAPPSVPDDPDDPDEERRRAWLPTAIGSIVENHEASLRVATRLAAHAAVFDLVYAPPETMTLRHARWAGRRTLNGRGMIVFQAAAALLDHVARPLLGARAEDPTVRRLVVDTMASNWGA
jgi:shikimate dehydrogenase